jgi:hypothetical protein
MAVNGYLLPNERQRNRVGQGLPENPPFGRFAELNLTCNQSAEEENTQITQKQGLRRIPGQYRYCRTGRIFTAREFFPRNVGQLLTNCGFPKLH